MLHKYISPTARNYAISYWRKIFHIKQPTGRNYAVSYWRKIVHIKQLTGRNAMELLRIEGERERGGGPER